MKRLKVFVLLGIMLCTLTPLSFAYMKIEWPVMDNEGSEPVEVIDVESNFVASGKRIDTLGGEVRIIRYIDKSTPGLTKFVRQQKVLSKLELIVGSDDGAEERYLFNMVRLKSVRVIKGKDGRDIEESIYKYKIATRAVRPVGKRSNSFIPVKPGDEVKVGFQSGDPNQPAVVGRKYSKGDKPSTSLDDDPIGAITNMNNRNTPVSDDPTKTYHDPFPRDSKKVKDVSRDISLGQASQVDFVRTGGKAFIKIPGIIGRTKDPNHKGFADVNRWELLRYQNGTGHLTIVKQTDRSSKMVKRRYDGGTRIGHVILAVPNGVLKFTGLKFQEYFGDVNNPSLKEEYTLTFRELQIKGNITMN